MSLTENSNAAPEIASLAVLAGHQIIPQANIGDEAQSALTTSSTSSLNAPARYRPDLLRSGFTADGPTQVGNPIELSVIGPSGAIGSSTAVRVGGGLGDADPEAASNTLSQTAPGRAMGRSEQDQSTAEDQAVANAHRRKSLLHFAALCGCLFVNGWNDGTAGPMLPRIQEHYHIGFAIVSLIFVSNAAGYLSGALVNLFLTDKFGFGKVLYMGSLCQIVAYAMLAPAGPYPLMCLAFFIIGFTLAIQAAQATGYVASLKKDSNAKMGILHGSYGLGALLSPLVATEFSKSAKFWSFHFIISAGLYVVNTAVLWTVFRGRRQEDIMKEEGETTSDAEAVSSNKFRQMISNKDVHFLSFWALIYVGIEVTMGGWSVTYILEQRNGSSNSGYISSGFFGGLMLGRVLLLWLNKKIGERRVVFIYCLLVIGLEVTVWRIPSLIENAIAVSLVGLLLGPMFPILINHSTTILPRWLLTACAGYIAAAGQAGSAVLPFITGLLASKFGITTLPPFIVSMMSTLVVLWAVIPRARYVPT
ncbi:MFS general substrate transporter [Cubamyces sp. BRFM 1775]|nr:MFS general substrate transporter [Cubamyces sp. BRFM 1775]